MVRAKFNIGFVRRGFSRSGGAEAYLSRLSQGLRARGHETTLFSDAEWENWSGRTIRLAATTPLAFADELEALTPSKHCDVLFSLERIWRCDFFRAGDGVHRSWIARRAAHASVLQNVARGLNRKHREILRLEQALLGERGADRVIANSSMVRDEIVREYRYPAQAIEVIYNGVRVSEFGPAPMKYAAARNQLHLAPEQIVVLFAGTGWERKGLRFALRALEEVNDPRLVLLVAGRGSPRRYRSSHARFLGEATDMKMHLAASDLFILPTLYDPFSNACLEALAAGLPVITTRSNGVSEIIEEKVHGSVVDRPDDVVALAEALRYWSGAEQRREARFPILERATQFDLSRNLEQTLALLIQADATAESTSGKILNT